MEDQVRQPNDIGIPAIAIADEEDELMQQVLNGNFVLVYGSPECLLSTESWRIIFGCESFKNMLIGVAIDEAHCITQWYVAIISQQFLQMYLFSIDLKDKSRLAISVLTSNRHFSLGGHVKSQENKKLCFCIASLAHTRIQCEPSDAKQSFLFS